MKQILVVSDSHRRNSVLNQIFSAHPDIDTCIHCGDLQDNIQQLQMKHLHIVRGNNDFDAFPNQLVIEIDGYRCLITHGHHYMIEAGTLQLEKEAKHCQANLVMFGHTHQPRFFEKDNIYYLNPGSVSFPRDGHVVIPTYAILTLDEKITCHFYHAKTHEMVDEIVFSDHQRKEKKKGLFSIFKRKH